MDSTKSKSTINFNEMKIDKLVDYLSDTQHSYLKNAILRFSVYMKTILKVDSTIHPEVNKISSLISELTELVEQHLIMEEHLLFPYIRDLAKKNGLSSHVEKNLADNPVKKIKLGHSKIISILENIRGLSNNYLPAVNSSPALKLCYAQLFDFEQDIHRHVFLEEKILFPKLKELEQRNYDQKKNDGKLT